jgi:hypothetical protein
MGFNEPKLHSVRLEYNQKGKEFHLIVVERTNRGNIFLVVKIARQLYSHKGLLKERKKRRQQGQFL